MDTFNAKLVLVTCPDLPSAHTLAEGLVSKKLAACVNIFPNVISVYEWQGQLEQQAECQLVIKTSETNWPELRSYVEQHHPYDIPEILLIDVEQGSVSYLAWMAEQLKKD